MDFNQMLMMLPGIQPDEFTLIKNITNDFSEQEKEQFLTFYQSKRRDQQNLTILTIVGFFGIAGLQRFVTDDVGMGVLYLLTLGFCGIGTIIDLINIRRIATDFNNKKAMEAASMVRMMGR